MGFGQYYSSQSYPLGQQGNCNAGFANTFKQTFQSLQQTSLQLAGLTMQMDNFCGADILGPPQGQLQKLPTLVPRDEKTNYYPNFDNNKNLRAHIRSIIDTNPNALNYLADKQSNVTTLIKDFTNPRMRNKEENKEWVNELLGAGFTNKEIKEMALLGAIHNGNVMIGKLSEKGTDKALEAAGKINNIRESQIAAYHKIDPPMDY